jgi:ElaB/YqjD/DUF883 family membrane-anchored ribosome-binding protein
MTTQTSSDASSRPAAKQDESMAQTVRNVADTVAGAAGEVGARMPEVAQSTREAFSEANRLVRRGSDQTLKVVGAASVGFAVGLLVGGANRLLIMASLIPAALVGMAMVERTDSTIGGARKGTVQGG